jgi:pimeloyl-ACP methyl ester carboxylesterase
VDSIGLGRFDVIGFSAGARIAIELTRRGASRVRSAVLLDPPLMSRDEYREWADRQAPRFPTEIAGVSARVDEASTFETLDEIVALLSPELPATARPQAEREVLANLVERTQTGGFQVRADAPNYWSVTTGQIAESLPASFDAFAGRVLLLIAERVDSVTESGHRALRSELGARLTSVGIDATHRLLWDSFDTTVSEIAQFLDDEDRKQPLV